MTAETFLRELRQLILSTRAPSVMLTLKAFKGAPRGAGPSWPES